jgi:hypothetical protein
VGSGWSGRPGLRYPIDGERFDEQYSRLGDDGKQGPSSGKGSVPVGLLRFRARAEVWRRSLERELLAAPLTASDRERMTRWLNNLRAREAWEAARLEHTVAVKRLLLEALRGGASPGRSVSEPAAEAAAVVRDEEDE